MPDISGLSPIKLAYAAQKVWTRLDFVMAEPIAIVGVSCRFPGGADDPEKFWELLRAGRDAVTEVPRERWDIDRYYDPAPGTPGKMYTREGAFLRNVDQFDPQFFGIAPREAQHMDPQQRLLLEASWEALERAGLASPALAGTRTGIFVGVMHQDYAQLARGLDQIDAHTASGNGNSVISGRLAHVLGTQGPTLTVDTACSSSLVAVHLACQSLRTRECDMALAGGVNLILSPVTTIVECSSRMLAADGRCKTFDRSADGFGRGEGCGVVVLKRLIDAITDRDNVIALIRGSAVNHDGRSSGLMVPNGKAQAKVIRDALASGGVDASQVGFVEAHGTGTSLGDPIEMEALASVFGDRSEPLVVGAVKTNIGHTEGSAGIAGLIKTALALQRGEIPPNVHFHDPSPRIRWDAMPVRVPTEPLPWPAGERRRIAGVSSFGYSGTNAHVVLEEAPALETTRRENDRALHLLTLSAKTEPALQQLTERFARHLETHPDLPIGDVCFTANTGRTHFAWRLSVLASTTKELRRKLMSGDVLKGHAPRPLAEQASPEADLKSIARLYVRGANIDWAKIDEGSHRTRVVLPTYPFQGQRCWVDLPEHLPPTTRRRVSHPLLGARLHIAGSNDVRFEGEISRCQPRFLEDHRVYGATIIPAAVYGEVALAAGSAAFGETRLTIEDLEFNNAWVLADGETHLMQTVVYPDTQRFRIFSALSDSVDSAWVDRGTGRVLPAREPQPQRVTIASLKSRLAERIEPGDYYEHFREGGLEYGPRFRAITELWRKDGEALARIEIPGSSGDASNYRFHPVLLDAGFHAVGASLPLEGNGQPWIPVGVKRLQLLRAGVTPLWCHIRSNIPATDAEPLTADFSYIAADGEVVALVEGFTARKAGRQTMLAQASESIEEWFYRVEWHPQRRAHEALSPNLAAPGEIRTQVAPLITDLASREDLLQYSDFLNALEDVSLLYVTDAFRQLGWNPAAGESFTIVSLARRLGVAAHYVRLLGRLIDMLAEEGVVERGGNEWRVVRSLPPGDAAGSMRALAARFPLASAETTLVGRCSSRLADVLRGTQDPLQLLFPNGDVSLAMRLYESSPGTNALNSVAAAAMRAAIEHLPEGRGLRVLEIGAGTGGTTAHILSALPENRTSYRFTDISPLFLNQAKKKFSEWGFIEYRTLDIEQSPATQDHTEHGYDIVIAANVLHATADLRQSLANARSLLAPGGMLMLLEGTVRQRWLDLTFGLTEGWWRFADTDLRPDYPLLNARQWETLLLESGFEDASGLASDGDGDERSRAAVIVARVSESQPASRSRRWLILADAGGVGDRLAEMLRVRGDRCAVIHDGQPELSPPFDGVVHLWSLDAPPANELTSDGLRSAVERSCISTLELIQSLPPRGTDIWFVTRRAQGVGSEDVTGVAQSPLWGMRKVIAQEHPDLRCVSVDLDAMSADAAAQTLLPELMSGSAEPEIAFRRGLRHGPRLVRDREKRQSSPVSFHHDATYLIAGGLGGLGLEVVRWMVDRGARHLVLISRRTPSDEARRVLEELNERGAQVVAARCDISDDTEVRRLIAGTPAVRGIIHAAGVLDDGILLHQTRERFLRVLQPKVIGTWNLHKATEHLPLDFFVLFSSTASLLGNPGQANHAAANAFEDSFAAWLTSSGRPGLSINWGVWSEVGSAADPELAARMKSRGVGVIRTKDGLAALEQLFGRRGQIAAVPLLNDLITDPRHAIETSASSTAAAEELRRLSESSPAECRAFLIDALRQQLSRILGLSRVEQIDPHQSLHEVGLDSLLAIELRNRIAADFQLDIPIEILVSGVAVDDLAQRLLEQLQLISLTSEPVTADNTEEIEEIAL
ncbi:MAG: SDR family NAD(P)-dependent oxidoreductase [Acidobacteriota bacterium]|nr:SDR family NAD(P)-dependent oxidoreductase [Acidobacteriota bacterium]